MIVQDNRSNEANIGDIIVTNEGKKYMLLLNQTKGEYPIAIMNLLHDNIEFTTNQRVFVIGGTFANENITEIIPKSKIKLVIE